MARIVLAADSQGLARAAVPMLLRLITSGDEVLLLRVGYDDDPSGLEDLAELERLLSGAGAHVRIELADGAHGVADSLARSALAFRADLVALGSHGRGRVGSAIAGSVSQETAAALECRVLVAHGSPRAGREIGEAARLRRLLLPLALGSASDHALELAAELATRHGAAVTVFHACPVVRHGPYTIAQDRAEATRALDQARLRLQLEGVAATSVLGVAWSGVAKAVAAVADGEDADLIVLESRRSSGMGALLGGGVMQGLLAATDRPLLLARRGITVRERAGALSAAGVET